ncbi:HK97 gp10 family phage protein [bacterium]|nr:HK97 gp10 family phage protein [bacterium]
MITTEIHGLKELEQALIELGSEVAGNGKTNLVKTALMKAALPVLKTAKATAPRSKPDEEHGQLLDDGVHLADTISRSRQAQVDPDIKANEVVDVGVFARGKGKEIHYAGFLEFGTSKMAAQPFLRRALETNRTLSIRLFRITLAKQIEKLAKQVGNKNAAAVASKVRKTRVRIA